MDGGKPEHSIPEKPRALPATEVLIGRLGWLIRLRWVAVGGSLFFVEVARRVLPIHIYLSPIYAVLGILALYNMIIGLVLRRVRRGGVGDSGKGSGGEDEEPVGGVARFILPRTLSGVEYYDSQAAQAALLAGAQIGFDLFFLALLLHFAGGIENPLRVFFLFHIIIASILLSRRATYVVATLGLVLLSAVALGEFWGILPHYALEGHWRSDGYLDPGPVGAQLFLLGVTLFVAAYLASSIAARLRRRELDVVVLSRYLADKTENLEATCAELSVAEEAKSQYMRKVAHELRGPLGTIRTALTVVLEMMPETVAEKTLDLIRRAHRRTGELADITQELLSLSRAKGGRAVADLTLVEPAVLARHAMERLQLRAEESGVSLSAEVEGELPAILGDPEGLGDLLANLLGNAVRYTPMGGSATLRVHGIGGRLVMEVEDTGIGIPKEDLPRIFDEFFRSKVAREFAPDGSGLGMAIVKAVLEHHEGSISVESALGEGTRVRVEIPFESDL